MKAIYRIQVSSDLVNPVDVLVPSGIITGLHIERSGMFYLHILADEGALTVTRQLVFAQAPNDNNPAPSTLVDATDMTGATYLGYAIPFHVWLIAQ